MIETVLCPHCGAQNERDKISLIDVCRHPELRESVLHLELFSLRCVVCRTRITLPYPCLYRNDEKRFIVRLSPPGMPACAAPEPDGFALRDTSTIYAFQEKIRIFEQDLDDRAVELLKAVTVARNAEEGLTDLLLVEADQDSLGFYAFREKGGDIRFRTPLALYRTLAQDIPASWTVSGYASVDGAWILARAKV